MRTEPDPGVPKNRADGQEEKRQISGDGAGGKQEVANTEQEAIDSPPQKRDETRFALNLHRPREQAAKQLLRPAQPFDPRLRQGSADTMANGKP